MHRSTNTLGGWPLVGWCALGLTVMAATILARYGAGEIGWRMVIRVSAQTSLLLFTSAFIASSLAALWPLPLTRWMLRNRRYLGVSFAASHLLHLVAILTLAALLGDHARFAPATVIGGGLAYVFIAAMTATSFDRTAEWLGRRAWTRLHTAGAYYIWAIFALQYVGLTLQSARYLPLAILTFAAAGLRIAAARAAGRRVTVLAAAAARR